jgi:hypothetical protein
MSDWTTHAIDLPTGARLEAADKLSYGHGVSSGIMR